MSLCASFAQKHCGKWQFLLICSVCSDKNEELNDKGDTKHNFLVFLLEANDINDLCRQDSTVFILEAGGHSIIKIDINCPLPNLDHNEDLFSFLS